MTDANSRAHYVILLPRVPYFFTLDGLSHYRTLFFGIFFVLASPMLWTIFTTLRILTLMTFNYYNTVADPGFPVGGVDL